MAADPLRIRSPPRPPRSPIVTSESSAQAEGNSPAGYQEAENAAVGQGIHILESKSVHWYSYLTTPDFWLVLGIGQSTRRRHTNIPAFQTMFNYVLLFLVYTGIFLYKEGPKEWGRVAWRHGWKYLIMSFLDVEGNYFTVLAYRYTNILSAQLINFWAIVCVVIISFFVLKVRYRIFQIVGILVCMGGMGILIASDQISGGGAGQATDMVKGDMFALVGATCYGLSNVFEEWLVSKAPCGHLRPGGLPGRDLGRQRGWLAGRLHAVPVHLLLDRPLHPAHGQRQLLQHLPAHRQLLGRHYRHHVFGLTVHFMYPIAFVCIIIGLIIYFLSGSMLGESKKPWLGTIRRMVSPDWGTAKLKALNVARQAQLETENGTAPAPAQQ
ncbi:unnamed protein product [Clonostachys rosea f. rosea IK726]|uniref:Uncharacterized protein n=1 Tax=Clonostachys rosea f. rosea IK726 TaxID=1349383 RepID=A0ACA9UXH1_BIOOC|nr:unnamed protein product [Clonostachys rosea f. rosea IK726]